MKSVQSRVMAHGMNEAEICAPKKLIKAAYVHLAVSQKKSSPDPVITGAGILFTCKHNFFNVFLIISVCVWHGLFLSTYFTIQLIFATI